MTIKELYDWAVKNNVEEYDLMPTEEEHRYSFRENCLFIYHDEEVVEIY